VTHCGYAWQRRETTVPTRFIKVVALACTD
jgi:hypothetical protein